MVNPFHRCHQSYRERHGATSGEELRSQPSRGKTLTLEWARGALNNQPLGNNQPLARGGTLPTGNIEKPNSVDWLHAGHHLKR